MLSFRSLGAPSLTTWVLLRSLDPTKAKRYIDTCRDQLFDIATQYRASFPEVAYDGVLQGWMTQRVTEFVTMLDRCVH